MQRLGIGLIGSGFMGRAHALAFRTVGGVFELPAQPELELIADLGEESAARAARALGFRRATANWQALLDPGLVREILTEYLEWNQDINYLYAVTGDSDPVATSSPAR